jgi:hypothetical protein
VRCRTWGAPCRNVNRGRSVRVHSGRAPARVPASTAPSPRHADMPRSHPLAALGVAVLGAAPAALAPATAAAQVGSTTDIVTGRVTNAQGAPVEGAQVTATSLETGVSRSRATNARGQYTILFPDGGGRYRLTVRAIGQQPRTLAVQRESDEDRLVADVQLGQAATQLSEVRVRANRAPAPGAQFRPEPGNTGAHHRRRAGAPPAGRRHRPERARRPHARRRPAARQRLDAVGLQRRGPARVAEQRHPGRPHLRRHHLPAGGGARHARHHQHLRRRPRPVLGRPGGEHHARRHQQPVRRRHVQPARPAAPVAPRLRRRLRPGVHAEPALGRRRRADPARPPVLLRERPGAAARQPAPVAVGRRPRRAPPRRAPAPTRPRASSRGSARSA